MIISKSIANSIISFFFKAVIPLRICTTSFFFFTTSFFIHSSVYEHLGGLHILTVVNRAAINIGVHFFLNYSLVWIDAQEWDCWSIC